VAYRGVVCIQNKIEILFDFKSTSSIYIALKMKVYPTPTSTLSLIRFEVRGDSK